MSSTDRLPSMGLDRRRLLLGGLTGLGGAALNVLLGREPSALAAAALPGLPHFPPRAKRVIFLCQSGAPSQLELFDYKPGLKARNRELLPPSFHGPQTTTGPLYIAAPQVAFSQHGPAGAWLSELLPHTAAVAGGLCIVRSMHTDQINHDPGITMLQTGYPLPGRPSMGAWLSYGLGSLADDLPSYVVLISKNTTASAQPLYSRLWGNGFLPSSHQGVPFRSAADPVLYLRDGASGPVDPPQLKSGVTALDRLHQRVTHDAEIDARIQSYETAYRMQISVPEVTDVSKEPDHTFDLYGPDSRLPGTYAASCLLARRLAERGVRFIQVFHRDWDHHQDLPHSIPVLARQTDQPSAALVTDLKQRGMLEDTLIVWGGEFGRTVFSQGDPGPTFGRDHHPRCFSVWLAGGGIKAGTVHGETDDLGYNVLTGGVHVHDLQATILRLLGVDHTRLTYSYLGRDFRLTDTSGQVVNEILA